MEQMITATIGKGKNKIAFQMSLERAKKVLWLQKILREQKEKEQLQKLGKQSN